MIMVAFLIIVALGMRYKNSHSGKATTKQLVFSSSAIALAMVASMVKLFEMPMGGSVTLLSMLFIVLIGYWFGPYAGLMTAIAYGLLQFILEPIFYTLPQMLTDYPLAFSLFYSKGFFIGMSIIIKRKQFSLATIRSELCFVLPRSSLCSHPLP